MATGKVNLIVHGGKETEIPVEGMKYMNIEKYPYFDHEKENLYLKNGRLVAVDETQVPPLWRMLD